MLLIPAVDVCYEGAYGLLIQFKAALVYTSRDLLGYRLAGLAV